MVLCGLVLCGTALCGNNIGCSKNGVVVQRVVHGTVLAHKLKYWEVSFQEHDDVNDVDPS